MARRVGPGPLENDGRGRGREGTGQQEQQQHHAWQTRQPGRGRSPLREAPDGNRKGGADSKNLRPHDMPVGGEDNKGITLRCMYTHQKTKKRKTWSDGAVKCCPKGQRVSLYRWSDALGVTDKLLGEIYLTLPQYDAFVGQAEPELEMETFLVSLDGVIQSNNGPSTGGTSSSAAAGGPAESTTAGATPGGASAGKKRKLFKAFKPPARMAPPPVPPPEDAWGQPPGRAGRLRNGGEPGEEDGRFSSGDDRGMLPRKSYTGFGHVESLWDDDNDDDGDGDGEERYGRGDRAGPAGSAVERNAGWGMGVGAGYPSPRGGSSGSGGGGGADTFPGHTPSSSSSAAAAVLDASGWVSGHEGGRHVDGRNTSGGLPRDLTAGHFPARQETPRFEDPAHRGQGQGRGDPSWLESLGLRSGDGDAEEAWPGAANDPAQRGRGHDTEEARDRGHSYFDPPQHDHEGGVARGGRPVESYAASQHGGEAPAPETYRDPPQAGRDGSGGGGRTGGGGLAEMRSTQDILSLFGGLEEDGDDYGSPGPRGPEMAAAAPPQQSRGLTDAPAPRPEATPGALLPVGGGVSRAADMRRAQKKSRAAAAGGAAAAAAAVAGGVAPSADWACGVCSVRGGAGATSCRVCGAERGGATDEDEGVPGQGGGDDHHGLAGGASGSDHRPGWGGAGFHGGEDWQEREWDEVAGDGGNAADYGGGEDDDLGGGRVKGLVSREEQDVAGIGHPGSPRYSPSSRMERGGNGAEGGGVARSPGIVPRASSQYRVAGVRMQIDVGSSSDSDNA